MNKSFGVGSFKVAIDPEVSLYQLKKKIKEELVYSGSAASLNLYLALKNGEWLGIQSVGNGEVTETIKELTQHSPRSRWYS